MRIAFRTDASLKIGTGHVMRCLTLADALRDRGAECFFVCRSHAGNLINLISQLGHQTLSLPVLTLERGYNCSRNGTAHADWLGADWVTDAEDTGLLLSRIMGKEPLDWLVVDHYALEMQWEQALRPLARRIMVIDDLADRSHDCDLLLDQNLGRKVLDYSRLLKGNTTTLIGPQFALLRPEFAAFRVQSLARRKKLLPLRQLLITMGGVDKDNATWRVLDGLSACEFPADLQITVVMGQHALWLEQIQAKAAQMPWRTEVIAGVNNMAQLMTHSDIAIGAAGSTSWERCCLGLPTIHMALADNQVLIATALSEAGAALMLKGKQIKQTLPELVKAITAPDRLQAISEICSNVTQGQGAKLVSFLMKDCHENNTFMQ